MIPLLRVPYRSAILDTEGRWWVSGAREGTCGLESIGDRVSAGQDGEWGRLHDTEHTQCL